MLHLFLFLTAISIADDKADKKGDPPPTPSPTCEDYETYFNRYKNYTEKAFKPSALADMTFRNNQTKEEKKFSEMSGLEKHTAMLMLGDRFTREMSVLYGHWENEVKLFDDPQHKLVPKPKIDNEKQKPAMKKEVEKYKKQLLALRKKFALEYEEFAVSMTEKFGKEIDAKERERLLKQIRDFHDEQKLVPRMKKVED